MCYTNHKSSNNTHQVYVHMLIDTCSPWQPHLHVHERNGPDAFIQFKHALKELSNNVWTLSHSMQCIKIQRTDILIGNSSNGFPLFQMLMMQHRVGQYKALLFFLLREENSMLGHFKTS